ncbi:hypothetical protein [Flavobacteriaceae bacterium A100]|uniref:hypothetical protein n=1 Tax=Oceanihabitans sediminis TaxID=1812012 RepID=UPI000931B43D
MKISTHIFAIVLSALLLFNSTRTSLTYAYYTIDTIGFIEALCENTDKPELACNGKCQLKKVAESQDSQHKTPESIINFKELLLFSDTFESLNFPSKIILQKQNLIVYQNLYSFTNSDDCFHPPQV